MKFSLCIPMYNESSIIEDTARQLSAYMQANFDDYEIIFSNDGSKDGCDKLVESLHLPSVRVVGYEQNRGKGYAVRTAMLAAKGDYVMFTDADLAYGTDVIGRVRDAFLAHPEADMVIGSRNLSKDGYEGYTPIRKLASKTYIKVLCLAGGFKLSDSQCGCKAFTKDAVKKIFTRCEVDRFAFDFEAILWAVKYGMTIHEIPVKIINHRESSVNLVRDTLKMLRDLVKMKRRIKKAKI
ncbi:MAG: glycosyltransferase [Clostridia bacterium]|nr:glycosyltransferase [Clostridia bacterium]MBQ5792685.1 glycosyltransferase [Clostridia bacterium]